MVTTTTDNGITVLMGDAGNDTLNGGNGDHVIIGGRGSDVLTGGTGNDVFTTDAIDGASNRSDQDIVQLGDIAPGSIGNDVITDFDTNNFYGGENNFDTLSFTLGRQDFNLSTGADIVNFVAFLESDGDSSTDAIQDGNDIIFVFARDENGVITDSVTLEDVIGDDGITQSRLNDASIDRLTDADVFADFEGSAPQEPGGALPNGNTLSGTDGADILVGTDGVDIIAGGNGADNLAGNAGNDILIGGAGNDFLTGDAGADTFVFTQGSGFDTISDFEAGRDQIDLTDFGFTSFDQLNLVQQDGFANLFIDQNTSIALTNVRNVDALSANDFILEGGIVDTSVPATPVEDTPVVEIVDTTNTITGTNGADRLIGTNQSDAIFGGAGNDTIAGDGGNDIIDGGTGNDFIYGEAGADTFVFTEGSGFNTVNDFVSGTDRIDVSDFGFSDFNDLNLVVQNNTVVLFLDANTSVALVGVRNIDDLSADDFILSDGVVNNPVADTPVEEPIDLSGAIVGTNGADILVGTNGDDTIFGGNGNDSIAGDGGNDVIIGGAGNDFIYGDAGADTFVFTEGSGFNTVNDFVSGTDRIDVSEFGFSDFNDLNLVEQNNTVFLFLDENTSVELVGVRNIDDLSADDFILEGGVVDGVVPDAPSADTPVEVVNDGPATLIGTNGADTLNGGNGNDAIAGNAGNDTIIGGAGNDFLNGDAGADTFVFAEGSGFDTINDFEAGRDQIDLSDFDFDNFNALNIVEQNNSVFVFIDENTSIELANIDDADELSADDFVL